MRFNNPHAYNFLGLSFALFFILQSTTASAQSPESDICDKMQIAVQQESHIPDRILSDLSAGDIEKAIECSLTGMRRNFGAVSNLRQSTQSDGVIEYNAFARAVRSLFSIHGYDAIGPFREQVSLEDVHTIARTVRHPIRNLRVNSGVILSNAIDNTNACVIIDQLYAFVPKSEIDTPEIIGRANLIYISRSLAKWARRENWDAMMSVIDFIEADISSSSPGQLANLGQTRDGLADLRQRLEDNQSSDTNRAPRFSETGQTFYFEEMSIAESRACADFPGYEFLQNWAPSDFYRSNR